MASFLWFQLAATGGRPQADAITEFVSTPLCRACGPDLTVGDVFSWALAAYSAEGKTLDNPPKAAIIIDAKEIADGEETEDFC
jgi:hypothetical protein